MRNWKYKEIDVSQIENAKENANKMSDQEFSQLVDNIRIGGLSSVPAVWHRKEDDKYIIIRSSQNQSLYQACLYEDTMLVC